MTRTATDFYPASGYRASDTGGLRNVDTRGYSWSNSPAGAPSVNGSYLDYSSSGVNPEISTHRAVGFPVRCVQE